MTDSSNPLSFTDQAALEALLAQRQQGQARVIDEEEMKASLKRRVRGQDHIVDDASRYIRLQWGKENRAKPIASVLFVGPPATGKTELGKAMTEYLFEDEKNMVRFDCSEFSGAEGKSRLIGNPTGYVGADKGGALTRPMFSNPKRLILFDEIEKAYGGIFDLFLSILGEGRLTEQGSNKTADFTQSIIVLTSNAEHEAIGALQDQFDDQDELSNAVRGVLRDAKVFRPEIISRFDRIYVFKPLEGIVNAEIVVIKIRGAAREYGVEVTYVDPSIVFELMEKAEAAKDTRELTRLVDRQLGDSLIRVRSDGCREVKIVRDKNGEPTIELAGELAASRNGA